MRDLGIALAQDRERLGNEPSPQRTLQPSVERTQERTQRRLPDEAPVQKQPAPAAAEVQPTATFLREPAASKPPSAAARLGQGDPDHPAQATEVPRAQQTAQARPEQSLSPSTPSTRPQQQRPERIDEPGHPGHDMFKQARRGLVELNANHGIVLSEERTDKLAAGLAASAALAGITRIDHVCLGTDGNDRTDGSKIFAAQGKPGSVFSKVAGGEVMPFMDAPLAQSSQTFVENQQQREALDQRFEQQWQHKLAQEAQQSQGMSMSRAQG